MIDQFGMDGHDIPLNPFRTGLYSQEELLGAFDPTVPGSYRDTLDFETYRSYVMHGRSTRVPYMHSIVRAIHDNSITQAIHRFIDGRKMVGIMGGHKMSRRDSEYRDIVRLARQLSEEDFTITSGGGPGAMEASHVGASLAGEPDRALDDALDALGAVPDLPGGLDAIVSDEGTIDAQVLNDLHAWQVPAFELARSREPGAPSLAIPTWHYGHEPPTPIASHIAKYFENSLREDGILAYAKWGVIFSPGKAGTIQEIFQDAAQNYYRSHDWFSPMVMLGVEYWAERYPVWAVLESLIDGRDGDCLTLTDDIAVAASAIREFTPSRP
jgi:predicted Rossmann-fold nucleotide-binding protein